MLGGMADGGGFGGEVADYYERYRRSYPDAVIDSVVGRFGLGRDDVVVDLGCGTGQLALPLAARVGAVVGVDPEPDMVRRARDGAGRAGVRNATWVLGADRDLAALGAAVRPIGAVTVAVAIHWMDRVALFADARGLLRDGGGIAVVTNGAPLWSQDTDWSRALRRCLQEWTGKESGTCQTDAKGRQLTSDALAAAGFLVTESTVDYLAPLSVEAVVGGVFSAIPAGDLPPPAARDRFAARVGEALRPFEPLTESVSVKLQFGALP
jgi:SAM-dependent methyltransferase